MPSVYSSINYTNLWWKKYENRAKLSHLISL